MTAPIWRCALLNSHRASPDGYPPSNMDRTPNPRTPRQDGARTAARKRVGGLTKGIADADKDIGRCGQSLCGPDSLGSCGGCGHSERSSHHADREVHAEAVLNTEAVGSVQALRAGMGLVDQPLHPVAQRRSAGPDSRPAWHDLQPTGWGDVPSLAPSRRVFGSSSLTVSNSFDCSCVDRSPLHRNGWL